MRVREPTCRMGREKKNMGIETFIPKVPGGFQEQVQKANSRG